MKKIMTAFVLSLLLVFSMAGGAFADITYIISERKAADKSNITTIENANV